MKIAWKGETVKRSLINGVWNMDLDSVCLVLKKEGKMQQRKKCGQKEEVETNETFD
jgi:hypothetical protein